MTSFTIVNARVLTLTDGPTEADAASAAFAGPRRGKALGNLGTIGRGWVRVCGGRVDALGAGDPPRAEGDRIDARGRVLMPGFVDCHTHACWEGSRFDEADERLAGVPYLEILRRGGGIMSTVRATRAATLDDLARRTSERLRVAARLGTTCIEVKSGYGLEPEAELRMLRAIDESGRRTRQRVVATFLGAHAKDPANPRFVDETIEIALPRAAAEFPGIACDAYCEDSAWSPEECRRYFLKAASLGCPIRVHADQFHSLGMVEQAIALGARSVDHLEATTEGDLARLAASPCVGVALPGCGFHLDGRYAPLRRLVDAGGAAAIASNANPGSSPTLSMPFVIALAVRHLRLTPAEAIACATVNAAHVLGLAGELGAIAPGLRADLQLLPTADERSLAYEYAHPGPDEVWEAGVAVHEGARL